jgi:hypothetical protein
MIISCSHLDLNTTHDVLAMQVRRWLEDRLRHSVSEAIGMQDGEIQVAPGHRAETVLAVAGWPRRGIVRYTYSDSDIAGHLWMTDVSWEQTMPEAPMDCSVMLEIVAESTVAPLEDIAPSTPKIVRLLAENASLTANSAGTQPVFVRTLGEVDELLAWIQEPARSDAIVIMSPLENNAADFWIPPEVVALKLAGLAKTFCLNPTLHTTLFLMNDVLGLDYRVFGGAARVVYPLSDWNGAARPSSYFWRKGELDAAEISGKPAADYIFEQVNERMRWRNASYHLSLDAVRELQQAQHREALRHQLDAQVGAAKEQNATFAELLTEAERERDRERGRADQLLAERDRLIDQLGKVMDENRTLKQTTIQAQAGNADDQTTGASALPPDVIDVIHSLVAERMTPYSMLKFIEACWPARVFIHRRAWASAQESERFRYRAKLFDLLWKLATVYWLALAQGLGDAQARTIFGKSYSAKESETTTTNDKARRLRTIDYKGQPLTIFPHLRIGVKENAEEGIRVHFDWDAADKKIVIGYCGKHLDLR